MPIERGHHHLRAKREIAGLCLIPGAVTVFQATVIKGFIYFVRSHLYAPWTVFVLKKAS